jgi:hypothetical protein
VKARQISKNSLLLCAEVTSGGIAGFLYIATPFCPDWVEVASGWDPDQHKGSVDWIVAIALLVGTLALVERSIPRS